MIGPVTLEARLNETARAKPALGDACAVVAALAGAGAEIAATISLGALGGGAIGAPVGVNADGDTQRDFDLRAQDILVKALLGAPVAAIASEELDTWALLDSAHPLAVAFDPLDGSSNLDANSTVGTIFSILPAKGANNPFIGRRGAQAGAGFFLYGPQANLVLTLGAGVDIYTFDRRDRSWRLTQAGATIPAGTPEYAINASNYRHWEDPVRAYIDDCLSGADGPCAKNFNMRWIGAAVAEAYRILTRGGVYLYPADRRAAYREGRLRLIYEALPIAFIIEQAGGKASTGRARILDLLASSLHQRVPMIFGSADKVAHIEQLHSAPARAESSPLFGHRGLFRV
jgi:fructose-1,6-bisphosphatase I